MDTEEPLIPNGAKIVYLKFLVPKFHLAGHKPECSIDYSFNFTEGVGRLSGEGIETVWSDLNWLKWSTQEMALGPRAETISDHMQAWNKRKIDTMCK